MAPKVCIYNPYAMFVGVVCIGIAVFAVVMMFAYLMNSEPSRKVKKEVVIVKVQDAPSAPTKCFDCEHQPRFQIYQSYGEPKLALGA